MTIDDLRALAQDYAEATAEASRIEREILEPAQEQAEKFERELRKPGSILLHGEYHRGRGVWPRTTCEATVRAVTEVGVEFEVYDTYHGGDGYTGAGSYTWAELADPERTVAKWERKAARDKVRAADAAAKRAREQLAKAGR